ncbi:MAG: DUF1272 domain-containing protein [Flavobacteriaceae bacterium]
MLEIRTNCENCNKSLPNESNEAMICTYECTFCKDCVDNVIKNVCPNCGGGFEKRPTRPKNGLLKSPVSDRKIHKPVTTNSFLETNMNIDPRKR